MFPGFFIGPLGVSIVARGIEAGMLEVVLLDLREHGLGRHRQLDDTPFGGGPGMVMMVEPLASALEPLAGTHRVLFTPAGEPLKQSTLDGWAAMSEITFVCGRFEGVDQRVVDNYIDEETSLGDFVVAGGEVAAALAIEGIARLLPGVVGNPDSTQSESFRHGLIEEPVYTRPADFRGMGGARGSPLRQPRTDRGVEKGATDAAHQGTPTRPPAGWRDFRDLIQFRLGRDYRALPAPLGVLHERSSLS